MYKFFIKSVMLVLMFATFVNLPAESAQPSKAPTAVSALQVVKTPKAYLNKDVVIEARFDKFSALGLDYKKAMRDSKDYIGFMILRDDSKEHNIPLSELKLFVKRTYAEKFVELDTGDKIKITGKVFSTALNDPWMDVTSIVIVEKVNKDKKDDKK